MHCNKISFQELLDCFDDDPDRIMQKEFTNFTGIILQ